MTAIIKQDSMTLITYYEEDLLSISDTNSKYGIRSEFGFRSKLYNLSGLWVVRYDGMCISSSLNFIHELTKVVQTSIDIKIER